MSKSTLLILLLFISCNTIGTRDKKNYTDGIVVLKQDSLGKLIDKAINQNDTVAYNSVASYHLLNNLGGNFLLPALVMANKNNSPEACYDVYEILAYSTPKPPREALKLMDEKTKDFALYYLLKSYEKGFPSAVYEVGEIFDTSKPLPTSSHYLQEFAMMNK
jgi:hypothetical protein